MPRLHETMQAFYTEKARRSEPATAVSLFVLVVVSGASR